MEWDLEEEEAYFASKDPSSSKEEAWNVACLNELKRMKRSIRACLERNGHFDLLHERTCKRKARDLSLDVSRCLDVRYEEKDSFETWKKSSEPSFMERPTVSPCDSKRTNPTKMSCSVQDTPEKQDGSELVQETPPIVQETPLSFRKESSDVGSEPSLVLERKSVRELFHSDEKHVDRNAIVRTPTNAMLETKGSQGWNNDGFLMTSDTRMEGQEKTQEDSVPQSMEWRRSWRNDSGTCPDVGTYDAGIQSVASLSKVADTPLEWHTSKNLENGTLNETFPEIQTMEQDQETQKSCPAVPVAMMRHKHRVMLVVLGGSSEDVYAAIVCTGDSDDENQRNVFVWQLSAAASVGEPFLVGGDVLSCKGEPDAVNIGLLSSKDDVFLLTTDCWDHNSTSKGDGFRGAYVYRVSPGGVTCAARIRCDHSPACVVVKGDEVLLFGGEEGQIFKASGKEVRQGNSTMRMKELPRAQFGTTYLPRIKHLALVPEQPDIVVGTCCSGSIAIWDHKKETLVMVSHHRGYVFSSLHSIGSLLVQDPIPSAMKQPMMTGDHLNGLYPIFFVAMVAERKAQDRTLCRPAWLGNGHMVVGEPLSEHPISCVASCGSEGILAWEDGVVTMWEPDSGDIVSVLEEHRGKLVTSIVSHHDTGIITAANNNGEVVVYSVPV